MKKTSMLAALLTWSIILLPCWILVGCDTKESKRLTAYYESVEYKETQIINFGQGVYYFRFEESSFGKELAAFLERNTKLVVTSMTVNPGHGNIHGYYVTFQEKN